MRPEIQKGFFAPALPRVIAHRGASGTHPENTMAAFAEAARLGAPYFELDVHMTRDRVVVVCHDPDLARTTGRRGLIRALDFDELSQFDAGWTFTSDGATFPFRGAGETIPRLSDVLERFPGVRVIVEVKQTEPPLIDALIGAIDSARARERVLIASEHHAPLALVRALAPDLPTNLCAREVGAFMQALAAKDGAYRPPGDALEVPPAYEGWQLVDENSVAFAHDRGLEVHVWTVNEPAEMQSLLALGVDGIITDFPARLLALIHSRTS
jgi:glycerophosphoryl diester phosphodiesterase